MIEKRKKNKNMKLNCFMPTDQLTSGRGHFLTVKFPCNNINNNNNTKNVFSKRFFIFASNADRERVTKTCSDAPLLVAHSTGSSGAIFCPFFSSSICSFKKKKK